MNKNAQALLEKFKGIVMRRTFGEVVCWVMTLLINC